MVLVSVVDSILCSKAATENGSCGLSFDFLLAAGDCVVVIHPLLLTAK